MDVCCKVREFVSCFEFHGSKNCFFGSIWWFMKILQFMGQLPIEITSRVNETKVQVTRQAVLIYCSVMSFFTVFAIYSHLDLKHGLHYHDPFARRVGLFQVIAVSITSLIGAINTFVMREKFVKVKLYLCGHIHNRH